MEFSNLANLNLRSEEAMTKRPRWVYYALFSPVVEEELLLYNMSRAWADWHCLSLNVEAMREPETRDKRGVQISPRLFCFNKATINR